VPIVDPLFALAAQSLHRLHHEPAYHTSIWSAPIRASTCSPISRAGTEYVFFFTWIVLPGPRAAVPAPASPNAAPAAVAAAPAPQQTSPAARVPPPTSESTNGQYSAAAAEIPAATQQQRLVQLLLETPMTLFAIAILVAARRIRRLGRQTIMAQQRLVLRRVLFRAALMVDRQRHAVRAVTLRRPTQGPQRHSARQHSGWRNSPKSTGSHAPSSSTSARNE